MNNTLKRVAGQTVLFLKRHSSTILTCMGAIGVVATTVTAVRATPKVVRIIQRAEDKKGDALTKYETFKVAAPSYIPATLMGLTTIACIFGSHIICKKYEATLLSAYVMLDNSYREYRHKVVELFGENADTLVRTAMSKDALAVEESTDEGEKVTFYEEHYGKFFECTLEELLSAESALNDHIDACGYAYICDFYNLLGLESKDVHKYIGWTGKHVDFIHELVTLEDGYPGMEYTNIIMSDTNHYVGLR